MTDATQEIQLTLNIAEINQILEALGQRTYSDVYRLVGKIQEQAENQLNENSTRPGRGNEEPS